ncbi:hypothetical protein [Porphyromonas gingivicanis]|uniref:hypothetical protein n=1 Tax=Porphyromonas gingivicanis TaxID=266762 RepID=UPI00046F1A53|nr:hypothetical protein [Porphyromonas gingivicanis]
MTYKEKKTLQQIHKPYDKKFIPRRSPLSDASIFLTGCNKPNKEPIKKENPWKQYAYGELPQLDFNKSPKEIKEEEYKMGARMVTQQDEYEGQSLIFSSYPHTGLVLRKYFFQQNRLVEVIQLIRPLSEVIKYDGKDSFTLNTTFQEWAVAWVLTLADLGSKTTTS